jgi:hypothetical protein
MKWLLGGGSTEASKRNRHSNPIRGTRNRRHRHGRLDVARLCFGRSLSVHNGQQKGKESTHSLPLSTYSAPGALRQDPGRAAEFAGRIQYLGDGSRDMRVLRAMYGERGDVEPQVQAAEIPSR